MESGPTGTVTFLFTDIEGSTERWQTDGRAMAAALAAHDELIRAAVSHHGGDIFKHTGDGMCAVFPSAPEAVAAAIEVQAGVGLPVRIGLHTGEAESRDGDYFGPTLNRAARVMDAGHGGQVLVSAATAGLVRGVELVDLGEHQLKGLNTAERIFQVGFGEFPPLRTPRPMVGNLPAELSTFVGRSEEVTALVEELDAHRLVTLIGVGGTGKTRLAIETAATVSDKFADGCWLVELMTVTVEEAVPFAFATGLAVTAPPDGDVIDHVVARLHHKRCLIVVDNCEHVLQAAADAVERIVAGCPHAVVLATSREPLMVRGERLVPVPSLPAEEAELLFVSRARDEGLDAVIDDEQRRAITELCRRLDGLPLALELAASRVRAFTPVELVANLDERFRMLVGGRRSRMERHQTMRGTLDWSYDLCSHAEQAVFDRLSVFPAGFDLSAARAVAAGDGIDELDVADVVPQLVDRSLLHRSTAVDGTTRYRMLETMRAYGREHLQHQESSDVVRDRHALYMARTLAALSLRTLGPDEVKVLRRLTEYLPDALVALDWFIDHRDWEHGMSVIMGQDGSARESSEMARRLHEAAQKERVAGSLLDELARADAHRIDNEPLQRENERGWRTIRARDPIPSDRFSIAPFQDFNNGGLVGADVDEFVASLDHWVSAPDPTRFSAEWFAIRALVHGGHLDRADQQLRRFAPFVTGLDSRHASRMLAELHGVIAMRQQDWEGAARWYGKVVDAADGRLATWFDLTTAWHLLAARCLSTEPGEITGAQLRDPWLCYQHHDLHVLQVHGAASTAIALHRLGYDHLADRLAAWVYKTEHISEFLQMMAIRLEAAGITTTTADHVDDLNTLITEVFSVADDLDR